MGTELDRILDDLDIKSETGLPDPSAVTFYKNLKNRVIWLDEEVTDATLLISKLIIQFNKEDEGLPVEQRKPIKICFFCYGGDAEVCFSVIDTILLSKTPVYTYNMGIAMSAGMLIFLAGSKRYCTKYSRALIHSGSGSTSGTYEQASAAMDNYKRITKEMQDFIIERTNIDAKLYSKKKSKDWYIYSDEQVSLGIADKIIDSIDEVL